MRVCTAHSETVDANSFSTTIRPRGWLAGHSQFGFFEGNFVKSVMIIDVEGVCTLLLLTSRVGMIEMHVRWDHPVFKS